jgi:hypothetical protein
LAAAVCGLLLAGLWLGGYPGAVILAGTACLFTAAVGSYSPGGATPRNSPMAKRPRDSVTGPSPFRRKHRVWLELSRPWLVAGLLLAAAGCAVVGERLLGEGASGPLVTALTNTAPQVICLVIVARLAAALFAGDSQ